MGHRVPKINMEILVDLGAKGPTRLDIFNKAQLNTEVSGASIILSGHGNARYRSLMGNV